MGNVKRTNVFVYAVCAVLLVLVVLIGVYQTSSSLRDFVRDNPMLAPLYLAGQPFFQAYIHHLPL